MKINLERNLKESRNKEQENDFVNTLNYSLFFSDELEITNLDTWKLANIKKLARFLKNTDTKKELNITYNRWNKNIEYFYRELLPQINLVKNINTSSDMQKIFDSKKYEEIILLTKNLSKDEILEVIFKSLEIIGEPNLIKDLNLLLNSNYTTLNTTLEMLIPYLLIKGEGNE